MSKKSLDFLRSVSSFIVKNGGFGSCLKLVTITEGGDGKCKAEFKVATEHLNTGGGLHGGFIATLVDIVTTFAFMSKEGNPPGVSVDLHVSYLKAAKEGDEVIVDATTVRAGRNLAYLECEFKHKKDGSLIAKGSHTKFVGNGSDKIMEKINLHDKITFSSN